MKNSDLDLTVLTVFDKNTIDKSPIISLRFAANITIRKTTKSGSRHFRGKNKMKEHFRGEILNIQEIPIMHSEMDWALRANRPIGGET